MFHVLTATEAHPFSFHSMVSLCQELAIIMVTIVAIIFMDCYTTFRLDAYYAFKCNANLNSRHFQCNLHMNLPSIWATIQI